MPQVGQFRRAGDSFSGRVQTFMLDLELTIVPAEPGGSDNAPDYRVLRGTGGGPEVGAGWTRSSDKAGEYISLQFDDPIFNEPVRALLFQNAEDATSWSLHWSRPRERSEAA